MDNSPGPQAPIGNFFILSWEQTCHLLGGGSWEEANMEGCSLSMASQHTDSPPSLGECFTHRPQFFFSPRHQLPWPLEVFWLKWRLLTSLARQLFASHSTTRTPFLDLCPERVQVRYPSLDDSSLPPQWSFFPFFLSEKCALPYTPQSVGAPEGHLLDPIV